MRRLKERQEGLSEEAVRIRDGLKTNGGRSRTLRISMGALSLAQKGLGGETEALARKDLAGAGVFPANGTFGRIDDGRGDAAGRRP